MEGTCFIVGAGDFFPELDSFSPAEKDYVIAADGGLSHLKALSIHPDYVLGDFDSIKDPSFLNEEKTLTEEGRLSRYPSEKDDTDMMLAVKHGLSIGYRRFILYGGTGGRMDHTIANLQTLLFLASQGATGYLMGEKNISSMITNGTFTFSSDMKGYLSIFSMDTCSTGITLTGLKYSMSDGSLSNQTSLGTSNEFLGVSAKVTVKKGSLLLIWERSNSIL